MPFVAEKCNTYHAFAISSLSDIYGDRGLKNAARFDVNELRSVLLRNDGQGVFSFEPLDRLAQLAPSFGTAVLDVNADGNLDVVLAQNFFSPQRETGRMDGSLGLLLLGDGSGNLQPVSAGKSGVVIPGDAKSALVVDVNLDGVPDVAIGINNEPLKMLAGNSATAEDYLMVKPAEAIEQTFVGARVTATYDDGTLQAMEVSAGSSYLSQGTGTIWFGTKNKNIDSVSVHWPGGSASKHKIAAGQKVLLVEPSTK